MAIKPDLYQIIEGLAIQGGASILSSSGAPGGDAGVQDQAPIGSIFLRTDIGSLYTKIATSNLPSDWTAFLTSSSGPFLKLDGSNGPMTGLLVLSGNPVTALGAATKQYVDTAISGAGTVTSVSVVSANGISGSVATSTTTPAITLTLGAITPTSVTMGGTAETVNGITASLQSLGTTQNSTSELYAQYSADALGSNVQFLKSRAASVGTNTATQSGDLIGKIDFFGINTTPAIQEMAYWQVITDSAAGSTFVPSRHEWTVSSATAFPALTMTMNANGLGIGASSTSILGLSGDHPVIDIIDTHLGGNHWQLRSGIAGSTSFDLYDYTNSKTRFTVQNDGNVNIGAATNPANNSRLYIFGGNNGANVDIRGDSAVLDQATIELEGSDYDTNTQSVRMQYYGAANPFGTTLGYSNVDLGLIAWQGANPQTAIIATFSNSNIHFGTNATEWMMLSKLGNLGIHTISPSANFQVNQATYGPGTVSNIASSGAITGVGTQFTNTFKIGDSITIGSETKTISAIASDTSLTTAAFTSAHSNATYSLTGGTRFQVFGNGNTVASGTFSANNFSGSSSGTNTGDQTISLTGDVTGSGTSSFAATISSGAVSLSKMANLAANSIIGNNTGSPATPIALSIAQVQSMLGITGGASVSSVGLALPSSIFNVTGSPVTTNGTLTGTLINQNPNTVFAGPSSGGAAIPTFRTLGVGDFPASSGGDTTGSYPTLSVFQAHLTDQAIPAAPPTGTLILASFNQQGFSVPHIYDTQGNRTEITRDNIMVARNSSGATITKGTAVYVSGSNGTVPTVAPAKADSASTMPAVGVMYEDTTNNSFGRVLFKGFLENYNLSTFSTGNTLYVSATTAGALTATSPSTFPQAVGTVINNGVGNGVLLASPDKQSFIKWNSAAGGDLIGTYPNPTIAAGAVSLSKMANLAANSIIGNNTGSPATPIALSIAQVQSMLGITGGASVSSVGLSAPSIFNVTGSPVTTSGTLAFSLINQSANTFLAGPSSGAATTPSFRVLTSLDIPDLSGQYVPYSGASGNVVLGSKTLSASSVLANSFGTIINVIGTVTTAATVNWSLSSLATLTLTAGDNAILSFTAPPYSGTYVTLEITQDGTATGTFTLPASVIVSPGQIKQAPSNGSWVTVLQFYYDGTNYFLVNSFYKNGPMNYDYFYVPNIIDVGGSNIGKAGNGSYIGWNYTSGSAEMDFINQSSGAVGGWNWFKSNGTTITDVMQLTASGFLTFPNGGNISTSGSNSGLQFLDRTSSRAWQWYGASDVARLFNGASDILQITSVGSLISTNGYHVIGVNSAGATFSTISGGLGQGLSLSWNKTSGVGEVDFHNIWNSASNSGANGGFNFYCWPSSTAVLTNRIDGAGNWIYSNLGYEDFGSSARQMINLWGGGPNAQYGIGIQGNTQYYRSTATTGAFAWFAGGTHSNTQYDPGAGGVLLAKLDSTGAFTTNAFANSTKALGTVTSTASLNFQAGASNTMTLTSATNCTVSIGTAPSGANTELTLAITQPASGTIPVVTFPSSFIFKGKIPVQPVPVLGSTTLYQILYDGTNYYVQDVSSSTGIPAFSYPVYNTVAITTSNTYVSNPFFIPANSLQVGMSGRFKMWVTKASGAGALTVQLSFGTAGTIADTNINGSAAGGAGTAAGSASIEILWIVRAIGSSGTIDVFTHADGVAPIASIATQNTATVNTTVNNYMGVRMSAGANSINTLNALIPELLG